jgi:hypothetical protein
MKWPGSYSPQEPPIFRLQVMAIRGIMFSSLVAYEWMGLLQWFRYLPHFDARPG